MQGGSSDRSSPTPDSAYHLPTTGDTVRLDSPTANQSLLSPEILARLADSGIRVRRDFTDPAQWVAAVSGHRTSAQPTPDAAVYAAIRWLIEEVQRQRDAKEVAERRGWWERLLD